MIQDILLPQLGMGMHEAEIVEWRKKVGERVAIGEILVEVGAEKTTVEVESPYQGVVTELCAAVGERLAVGAVMARLRNDD